MEKVLFTTKETAEYLGVTPAEVRQLVYENNLQPVKGFKNPFKFSIFAIRQYTKDKLYPSLTGSEPPKKIILTTEEVAAYLETPKRKIRELAEMKYLKPLYGARHPLKFSIFMVDRFLGKYENSEQEYCKKTKKLITTTREVATYLGMPESEIRRLADGGYLKPLKGFKHPFKFSIYVIDRYIGKYSDPPPSELEILAKNAFRLDFDPKGRKRRWIF